VQRLRPVLAALVLVAAFGGSAHGTAMTGVRQQVIGAEERMGVHDADHHMNRSALRRALRRPHRFDVRSGGHALAARRTSCRG
jgi:hypothetical protein